MPENDAQKVKSATCGCGGKGANTESEIRPQDAARIASSLEGHVATAAGDVPRVASRLSLRDRAGIVKVRCGIKRNAYRVPPGLYAVGRPDANSPVLVTANYKYSFDSLRQELTGRDAWVLVLNTKGINVWCAAGKGTFGTAEVVKRVTETRLDLVVSHRKLILPQLGAPGVAAHEVQKQTGFRVVFGPVRAADVTSFLDRGMKATPEMRAVEFGFRQRLAMVPEEIVAHLPLLLVALAVQAGLSLIASGRLVFFDFVPVVAAVLAGCALVPMFLPWIPGRAFSFKGWLAGVVVVLALEAYEVAGLGQVFHWRSLVSSLFILPVISAYAAMNFTGTSTFTSLSGVVKEMSRAVPLMLTSASLSIVLFILTIFVKF
jgi:hypothetical protein